MSLYSIPADGDYDYVRQLVRMRIDSDAKKGGPFVQLTEFHERLFAEHVSAAHQRGAACDACGETWPCQMIHGIMAMD